MKKYINLFTQQAKQKKSIIVLHKLQRIGYISVLLLVVIVALEWGGFYWLQGKLSEREKIKNRYYNFILQNQRLDAKISRFIFKYDLLKQSILKDAHIYYYYDLLTTLLENITTSATITSFSIDNTQTVEFSVQFDSYDSAISFLSQMESGSFIGYFDQLELKDFTIGTGDLTGYQLQFDGKFKPLTNAT